MRFRPLIATSIALAFIAGIVGIGWYQLVAFKHGMMKSNVRTQMKVMARGVHAFFREKGHYPSADEFAQMASMEYWTDEFYNDPFWGHPFIYVQPQSGESFSIRHLGRDGLEGGSGLDSDFTVLGTDE